MQHTSCKLVYMLLPGIVNRVCMCVCVRVCVCVCVLHIKYFFFNFIEILTADIIFMTKGLALAFSNQVLLQDYIWKCK